MLVAATVKAAIPWRGRQGAVLLGPTEGRVAFYLERMTRFGRVTLRTSRIQDDLGLGRSETYRILRTLRTLGLFGIENDQGGQLGGRRIWRTARADGPTYLDGAKHRQAWARITAAALAVRRRILEAVRRLHSPTAPGRPLQTPQRARAAVPPGREGSVLPPAQGPPMTMRDAILRWSPALAKEWRLTDA